MLHPHTKPKDKTEFEELYLEKEKLNIYSMAAELFLYIDKETKKTVFVKKNFLTKAGFDIGSCYKGWVEGNLIQNFEHPNVIRVILLL